MVVIPLSFHHTSSAPLPSIDRLQLKSAQPLTRSENLETNPQRASDESKPGRIESQTAPDAEFSLTASEPKKKKSKQTRASDGTFNGYPVYYNNGSQPIHSSVHCIGQNYQENAWIHRSCKFRHFCFDTTAKEFVLYQSKEEQELDAALASFGKEKQRVDGYGRLLPTDKLSEKTSYVDSSALSMTNNLVSIGGINKKWTWKHGVPRLKWFPKIIKGDLTEPYYELDDDVVWVPYHSFFAQNPGHLVWDDFLPVYTLLRIFGLLDNYTPLLQRFILPGKGMWATCDMNTEKNHVCASMYHKFLPLFGLSSHNFSTTDDYQFLPNKDDSSSEEKKKPSNLICAKQGAAGLGMLTDHGYKLHGWEKEDYEKMHNHGRGSMLFDFRNFMLDNVVGAAKNNQELRQGSPYVITFAESTSRSTLRDFSFELQMKALKEAFGSAIIVQSISFSSKSVADQLTIVSETAIYVSACGGGAVTATFLPKGAALVLFYVENGGIQNNRQTGLPARLDWDIFNNMAWIRSHWLASGSMNDSADIALFVKLVGHELDLMEHQLT
jgi:hypothetical protein